MAGASIEWCGGAHDGGARSMLQGKCGSCETEWVRGVRTDGRLRPIISDAGKAEIEENASKLR